MTDAVGYELAGQANALLFMKSNFMGVNSQMISNIKDTLLVSLLMIASLSYVENAIAGPYSGALYQGQNFVGTYTADIGDCNAVLEHHQNQLKLLGWQVSEAEEEAWGLVLIAKRPDDRRIVIQCNWG